MHALLIIVGINAAMLGVAFTFGGFSTIVAPSTAIFKVLGGLPRLLPGNSWVQASVSR